MVLPRQEPCTLVTKTGTYTALCFQPLRSEFGGFLGAEISIAKSGNAGLLILRVPGERDDFRNNVIVYLDDNSVITLINRSVQWKVNQDLFGQYNLISSEIARLKASNIRAIRFWTCPYGAPDWVCDNAREYYNQDVYSPLSGGSKLYDSD